MSSNPDKTDSGKPLAFVIEDDEDLATIFAKAVEAAEYEVEVIHLGDVAMRRLRVKVDDDFDLKLIHTVRGRGYVLEASEAKA